MVNFIFYKLIVLLFGGAPTLLGFYGLFLDQNVSKLMCVSLVLIGISLLVYGWDYDRRDFKRFNRRRRLSNWFVGSAAVVYILKLILDFYA